MSGISSITSSPASSTTSNALSTSGLSAVGASLLTTGAAPNVTPASTPATGTISSYESQYLSLQTYDTQELLYASFLSPSAGLANADSVLGQAAALLDTPSTATSQAAGSSTTASGSSTSSTSSSLTNLPSVASILAASDNAAQQTLTAYANAPVGSSILDYQA
jgi:hypothetical protein